MANEERAYGIKAGDLCTRCSADIPITSSRAIEVGHTFLLGTKYSSVLKAEFTPEDPVTPGERRPMQMGCYGLGLSRIVAAIVETSHDEHGIVWPFSVAPYRVCIVPGLKDVKVSDTVERLYDMLNDKKELKGEIVIDDRMGFSLGHRLKDAELVGYSLIIVLGKNFLEGGKIEVQDRKTRQKNYIEIDNVGDYVVNEYS